jgi:hypothetical protein
MLFYNKNAMQQSIYTYVNRQKSTTELKQWIKSFNNNISKH